MSAAQPNQQRHQAVSGANAPSLEFLDMDEARERFEASTDFTIAIEEEFALVDPETLELEHRFEELHAACQQDEVLAEAAVGELISSEIEIRSGRSESFAEALDRQRDRRGGRSVGAPSPRAGVVAVRAPPPGT